MLDPSNSAFIFILFIPNFCPSSLSLFSSTFYFIDLALISHQNTVFISYSIYVSGFQNGHFPPTISPSLDYTPQYSCLGSPMGGGAWQATVHGAVKSQTRLSDFTFTFHFHELEREMATHSSILAWRIPGTGAQWAAIYGIAQSRTQLT